MTVDVRTPVNNYVGNDSATQFNFNFYIESSSQLEVYHTNRSGLQTKLTLGTDYSINAVGSETGSYITFPITGSTYTVLKGESSTGAGDAEKLSLVLSLPISQETEYGISDKLNLNSLEYSLDYLTRIAQIMNRQLERAVKVSESSSINTDDLVNKINTVYKNISDINAIVADLTNINNVADDLTNINTVSTNITNVNAVGSDIANVNAVKNDLTNIDAVNANKINIDTVAADLLLSYSNIKNALANANTCVQKALEAYNSAVQAEYWAGQSAQAQIQSNWNETDSSKKSYILNKPTNLSQFTDNLGNNPTHTHKYYARQVQINGMYAGENLATKFASEISSYSSIYDWLSAKSVAEDFDGMAIDDYMFVTTSAGTCGGYSIPAQTHKCRIAGFNMYKHTTDTEITTGSIDFISDSVIDTPIPMQTSKNNNGTSVQNNPYLSSIVYAVLNKVNNYTTSAYNSVAHGVNASNQGVIDLLPSALQNVLKTKRSLLGKRYSSSGLLTVNSGWEWQDMGKLWIPTEVEVYGYPLCSVVASADKFPYEGAYNMQFPIFNNKAERLIKYKADGTTRATWWLCSPSAYNSTTFCNVHSNGNANSHYASNASICVPLCFTI